MQKNPKCKNKILASKRILLGVTGSIAAYKAAYIASSLIKLGADVHVVMTEHAAKLITPTTFWALTSNPVSVGLFDAPAKYEITHISLPENSDLALIAPASANIIGKIANGIADDMLSTMIMSVLCPKIICPAMNVNMFNNPVMQENLAKLKTLGWRVIEPEEGRLACGTEGKGRLAEPDFIIEQVIQTLALVNQDYAGLKVLVTAGPTQEAIDPVRFISNKSSGKMGYAIAECAKRRGAKVTIISGPVNIEASEGIEIIKVKSVNEMLLGVKSNFQKADVFIGTAAAADFVPAEVNPHKIKKSGSFTIPLTAAPDIIKVVGANKGSKIVVGFAAETQNLEENANKKLIEKNLDMIIANDVSENSDVFGSDFNQVSIISKNDIIKLPRLSKLETADKILDKIITLIP